MRGEPTLHAAFENTGSVETKIDKSSDSDKSEEGKRGARSARGLLKDLARAVSGRVARGLENQKANRSEDSGGGGVEDALESVNAEGIGERDFVLARDKQGTERLGNAAENEESAKAGEIHSVDVPEAGGSDMGLESLPAPSTNGITKIDGDNREEQVGVVCATNGVPELYAAELTEMEEEMSTEMVKDQTEQDDTQSQKQPSPRLSTHEAREYWWGEGGVKGA